MASTVITTITPDHLDDFLATSPDYLNLSVYFDLAHDADAPANVARITAGQLRAQIADMPRTIPGPAAQLADLLNTRPLMRYEVRLVDRNGYTVNHPEAVKVVSGDQVDAATLHLLNRVAPADAACEGHPLYSYRVQETELPA
ncbi:hypothetical protein [Streptomyces sp. ME19-01-6]|uniref:hypothetical protein n=1 Tax=Streptomyces sp. ME19-01-6 TaxID=3028686 RepID=UPI0029A1799A|nr:hypothetical protein [Streptomyces sp. ME19-01-6]MDX3232949.1 hypothetical protein [Streptomyces sp. ME19-01-6]